MIYNSVFHPEAEKEFLKAIVWYESELIGLGLRFQNDIFSTLSLVLQTPLIYQITNRNFREAVIQDFPFVIVYKIDGDDIFISSIFHTSRNPKKKYRK